MPFGLFWAFFPLAGNHPEVKTSALAVVRLRFLKIRGAKSKRKKKEEELKNHALAVVKAMIPENQRRVPRAHKKKVHL